jgi:prephenate dehydrogenase
MLGLGLMGASLGMALRVAGAANLVVGYDASPGVADRAYERGAIDVACTDVAEAVTGADLVILAAPICAAPELLSTMAPSLAPRALVTDLGSVKAQIVTYAERTLPHPDRFIGGHPMTGSERSGVDAARADLFADCVWALTPTGSTASETTARLAWMIRRLGATPLLLDSAQHEVAVALVSHLPRIAAIGLALTAARSASWPLAQELAAGGFRDTTRVAASDPMTSRDICLNNTPALLASLDAYIETLSALRSRIASGDATLEGTFASAKRIRDEWGRSRQW